jgi:GxxExxY protein
LRSLRLEDINAKDAEVFAKNAKKNHWNEICMSIFMHENELSKQIIGVAIEVHTTLGPGLLESAYKEFLYFKLKEKGMIVEKEKTMPLILNEVKVEYGYRIDLLVENKIVIEVKSVTSLTNIQVAQILTYLKLSKCKLGLLINFNVTHLKDGIRRVVHNL